jgi:hypothetical protein
VIWTKRFREVKARLPLGGDINFERELNIQICKLLKDGVPTGKIAKLLKINRGQVIYKSQKLGIHRTRSEGLLLAKKALTEKLWCQLEEFYQRHKRRPRTCKAEKTLHHFETGRQKLEPTRLQTLLRKHQIEQVKDRVELKWSLLAKFYARHRRQPSGYIKEENELVNFVTGRRAHDPRRLKRLISDYKVQTLYGPASRARIAKVRRTT